MTWRRAVFFAACLSACSPIPGLRATRAGADSVTYEFAAEKQGEALRQAMLYCANLGRGTAVLADRRIEADARVVATYDCR